MKGFIVSKETQFSANWEVNKTSRYGNNYSHKKIWKRMFQVFSAFVICSDDAWATSL